MKLILHLLCGLLLTNFVRAQTSAPVYISFSFEAPSATNNILPSDLPVTQDKISARLAQRCGEAFPYWTMLPGNSAQHPTLRIWLTEDQQSENSPWFMNMQLFIPGRPPLRPWNGNFFPPGEYRRLADTLNVNRWIELVEQHFVRDVLPPNQPAIQLSLQSTAPLGLVDSSILKDPLSTSRQLIVLPLDWNSYGWFSRSEFVILCSSSNGIVRLHLIGSEQSGKFTPNHPRYDGMVAKLNQWELTDGNLTDITNHFNEIESLQPGALLLNKPIESSPIWAVGGTQ